jgi:sugar phosphate isomerase/epimerase
VANRLSEAARLAADAPGVRLLADLYHVHLEEPPVEAALREHARVIGHVHFCDSNRRPAGCGEIDFAAVGRALRETGYAGFCSAEALPWPDPEAAARQTMRMFREHVRG